MLDPVLCLPLPICTTTPCSPLFAGVNPRHTLPITLDVGTENETLRALPWYCGLRQGRPSRDAYDNFVDEFVKAVKARFGPRVLLQVRVGSLEPTSGSPQACTPPPHTRSGKTSGTRTRSVWRSATRRCCLPTMTTLKARLQ